MRIRWPSGLRRRDQLVVAAMTLILGGSLVASLFVAGGHRGELVDIDNNDVRPISFKLDINRAEWPEFALLPGIGELRARRIVELRRRAGPFRAHQELMQARGIGPKTFSRMRPFLLPMTGGDLAAAP